MCQSFILYIGGVLWDVVVGCVLILNNFHFQGNKPVKIHVGEVELVQSTKIHGNRGRWEGGGGNKLKMDTRNETPALS